MVNLNETRTKPKGRRTVRNSFLPLAEEFLKDVVLKVCRYPVDLFELLDEIFHLDDLLCDATFYTGKVLATCGWDSSTFSAGLTAMENCVGYAINSRGIMARGEVDLDRVNKTRHYVTNDFTCRTEDSRSVDIEFRYDIDAKKRMATWESVGKSVIAKSGPIEAGIYLPYNNGNENRKQ